MGPLYRCVVVYMDDIRIYSPTLEQHVKDVDEVLAILGERKLFAKALKCEFGRQELGFLGHRVSAEGIKVDHSARYRPFASGRCRARAQRSGGSAGWRTTTGASC